MFIQQTDPYLLLFGTIAVLHQAPNPTQNLLSPSRSAVVKMRAAHLVCSSCTIGIPIEATSCPQTIRHGSLSFLWPSRSGGESGQEGFSYLEYDTHRQWKCQGWPFQRGRFQQLGSQCTDIHLLESFGRTTPKLYALLAHTSLHSKWLTLLIKDQGLYHIFFKLAFDSQVGGDSKRS